MPMSKKDYQKIAEAIWLKTTINDRNLVNKLQLVEELCKEFKEDNPRFNPEKFKEACGLK